MIELSGVLLALIISGTMAVGLIAGFYAGVIADSDLPDNDNRWALVIVPAFVLLLSIVVFLSLLLIVIIEGMS